MAHTIEFEGIEVEYDPKKLNSWKVQKMIAKGGEGPFDALDVILCGKSDEVAEQLGDDASKMTELVNMLVALSPTAKN